MPLQMLVEAIDALVDCDAAKFADPESLLELHRQLSRLDAVVTAADAAFDASGTWALDGAYNAGAWLATTTRQPKPAMAKRLRLGERLRHLPATEAAWAAGDIDAAHAAVITSLHSESSADILARDESVLVEQAKSLRFSSFTQVARYWADRTDPEGAERDFEAQRAKRDCYLVESYNGLWFGQTRFDPIAGTIVAGELKRLEQELFDADWAEAKARLGREPTLSDLRRTPGQRRADAFVEMATRSAAAADARRPVPLFTVLMGDKTLDHICELANGTVVPPGSLVPFLIGAELERYLLGLPNRTEISHRTRLFSGATRRIIEVRDRACTHVFCDRPAEDCEVDHIVPYSDGGFTTQENGRLLCGFHNRLRHGRPPPSD